MILFKHIVQMWNESGGKPVYAYKGLSLISGWQYYHFKNHRWQRYITHVNSTFEDPDNLKFEIRKIKRRKKNRIYEFI